jgi:hypothetical protein
MKTHRFLTAALLAGLQAACATGNAVTENSSSHEFPAPPPDVMAIRTYWAGEQPPCPVVRVMDLSAQTENGLRWGAWNARAQAVVAVRSRLVDSMPTQPRGGSRVFEGVAVRFAEGCTPPEARAAS